MFTSVGILSYWHIIAIGFVWLVRKVWLLFLVSCRALAILRSLVDVYKTCPFFDNFSSPLGLAKKIFEVRCTLSLKQNPGLNGIRTHDLCDTGGVLYQLSYQAIWELVTPSPGYLKGWRIFKITAITLGPKVILGTRTIRTIFGRRGGLVPGASGPGSSPGRGDCIVFLGKTLHSHSASLHPGV